MTAWHDCTALQRDLLKAIADHDHYDREATADALQIAVETRREATLDDARVTDSLAELEANDLVTTTDGTYALTDRGQDAITQAARSLAIVTGHDLVATDGGTTIPSHTAAATRLDTVLQAAEPALADEELELLDAVSTYLRNTDGFVVETHAEPAIRSHACEVIATREDGHGAPAGDVLDTLAREYGAQRALTALLDLLVQGDCYQPQPATLGRVDTDTADTGGGR
ncbi:transcriptional regulator [Haloarcula sp. Atlit-120R]|uniref:transcriptional regulator n=1 Tax=Haloarcula sp. Atlit-120R TaxID=2282135 RepID=UPI000EF1EA0D|nr:transcriptional regulator [Haloarcula sp. Atlit-120R]RLM34401.1 transcriptional regulator [Haloarcula sp. Atlit-120R]